MRHWFSISILFFLLLLVSLITYKVLPYSGSLSALIGIWDGFSEINPQIVDSQFVIFKNGGYDGQFFYFIAKSLFTDQKWDLILDSNTFRLHRIGFSVLAGLPSLLFGFRYYPLISIMLPIAIFLVSAYCLHKLLPDDRKKWVLFYLFSPYSLNSHLLLVADGLFTSLALIFYYIYSTSKKYYLAAILLTFTVFTREMGVLLIIPIVLFHLHQREYKQALIFSVPFILFCFFLLIIKVFSPNHYGTNPLDFQDMVDFPLLGFFKSFIDGGHFHLFGKEFVKIFLFLQFTILLLYITHYLLQLFTSFDIESDSFIKSIFLIFPILGSLVVILLAEQGYWRSFDNLSRMFTLLLPLLLLHGLKYHSKLLYLFLYSSLVLFVFLLIRILFITKAKEYYLAP